MRKIMKLQQKNLRKLITILCILSLVLAFTPCVVLADDTDETIEDEDGFAEEEDYDTEEDEDEEEAEESDIEILKTIKMKLSKDDRYQITTITLPSLDDEYFEDDTEEDDVEDTEEDIDEDAEEDVDEYTEEDVDDEAEQEEPYLIFTSSNSKIATVSKAGLVKAKKPGKVTITAENNYQIQQFTITVTKAVKKITPSVTEKKLKIKKSFKIKYTLTKGTFSKVTFKSSDRKVALVNAKGKVTAKKKGVATITLTTYNKKKATVKIIVE